MGAQDSTTAASAAPAAAASASATSPAPASTPPAPPAPKTPAPIESPISLVGRPGQLYNIRPVSENTKFGVKPGSLVVSNRMITFTTWNDNVIKGELPSDLPAGEIVLTRADGTTLKGTFKI